MPGRLLLLSSEFPPGPGGIGCHAHQLALQLNRRGWDVAVLTRQAYCTPAEAAAFRRAQPMAVTALPGRGPRPLRWLGAFRHLEHALRARPQVIAASGASAIYLAALGARRAGLPWLAVEHGRLPPAWERPLGRASLRRADAVVFVSEYTRARCHASGLVAPTHSERVIPNGVDVEGLRPLPRDEARARLHRRGLPRGRYLITVGHVSRRKGQDVVVRALGLLREEFPDLRYLVVGLPALGDELRALAHSLGVGARVHLRGRIPRDQLAEHLGAADLFLMTSRHTATQWEGYGIAVLEAALCGLPAIVSAPSGLAEAVVNGATGVWVAEDDPAATAAAIRRLLQDPRQLNRLGENARARAQTQSWAHCAAAYQRVLEELIAGR